MIPFLRVIQLSFLAIARFGLAATSHRGAVCEAIQPARNYGEHAEIEVSI